MSWIGEITLSPSYDNGVGGALLDVDIDTVTYQGQPVEFVDDDKAADYLEFCWGESDQKDYRWA